MQKLIIISLILFTDTAFSQLASFNLEDSVARWQVRQVSKLEPCQKIEKYIYYVKGDTSMGHKAYKKIYVSGHAYLEASSVLDEPYCKTTWNYRDIYAGGIREDSNRIYYNGTDREWPLFIPDTGELMLYDFNLEVGDTLPFPGFESSAKPTIDSVDSVLIDGKHKIRYWSGVGWTIEGIGNEGGLLESNGMYLEAYSVFTCYSENEVPLYSPPHNSDCSIIVGIEPNSWPLPEVQLYPNPSTGFYNLTLNLEEASNVSIAVYDMVGKRVVDVVNGLTEQSQYEIDLSNFEEGIYFLRAQINEQTITKKLSLVK